MKTSEEKASAANLPSPRKIVQLHRDTQEEGGGRRKETQKGGLDGCVRRKWAATGFCFLGTGEAVVPHMERIQSQGNWRETNFEFANLSRQTKRPRMVCLRRETIFFFFSSSQFIQSRKNDAIRTFLSIPFKVGGPPFFRFWGSFGGGAHFHLIPFPFFSFPHSFPPPLYFSFLPFSPSWN